MILDSGNKYTDLHPPFDQTLLLDNNILPGKEWSLEIDRGFWQKNE
jgi:hypothetical protein